VSFFIAIITPMPIAVRNNADVMSSPAHGRSGSKIAPIAPAIPRSSRTIKVTRNPPPAIAPITPRPAMIPTLRTDALIPSSFALMK